MKERSCGSPLPDGALDLGNGVIGPSLSDRNFFNSLRETRKGKTKRLILPITTAILGGIGVACSGGGNKNTVTNAQELEKKESGYTLPFPEGETWFLTTGPHGDGYSRGTKYAIDIAPPEGGFCPTDGRKFTIDNRVVTASASGEVIIKGDDRNRNDPHHSEIRIKDKNGLTQVYIHLDNTKKIKVGDKVKQGDPLGNPSCEFPPGGGNTGPHLHIGLMKDGVATPINNVVIDGWTIHENGTMTKPGEKTRTADIGRYGENSAGIRNDLPNKSNKAVVAGPKDPIPPISGQITSKEVLGVAATPTPKPTETPYPTPIKVVATPTATPKKEPPTPTPISVEKKISISKKPEELFRALLTNPIPQDILPSRMDLKGTSAGKIDATGQALKQVGAVNIIIEDSVAQTVRGFPNGGILYAIFSDSSGAKAASDIIGTHLGNGRDSKDFPYPTKIYTQNVFGSTNVVVIMSVQNVTVVASLIGSNQSLLESRSILLAQAAIEHLKKVGK